MKFRRMTVNRAIMRSIISKYSKLIFYIRTLRSDFTVIQKASLPILLKKFMSFGFVALKRNIFDCLNNNLSLRERQTHEVEIY